MVKSRYGDSVALARYACWVTEEIDGILCPGRKVEAGGDAGALVKASGALNRLQEVVCLWECFALRAM